MAARCAARLRLGGPARPEEREGLMSDHVVRVLATSLASAALALGAPALSSARPIVVNPDSSGAIPWQALVLQMSGGSVTGLCGGSVRDQLHVITAAHCVVDEATGQVIAASSFGVVGGLVHVSNPEPDRQPRAVTTVSVDPDFTVTAGALLNDAAILTLDQPLDLSNPSSVRPLAPVAAGGTGTVALISGFGLTDPANSASLADVLEIATIDVLPASGCANYGADFDAAVMLCAGRAKPGGAMVDTCQGDSGGPLSRVTGTDAAGAPIADALLGITSFGRGCADPSFPGIYTNVADPKINAFVTQPTPASKPVRRTTGALVDAALRARLRGR